MSLLVAARARSAAPTTYLQLRDGSPSRSPTSSSSSPRSPSSSSPSSSPSPTTRRTGHERARTRAARRGDPGERPARTRTSRTTRPDPDDPRDPEDGDTSRMWTARLVRLAVDSYPPEKLLPGRQPTYVASWIYVFGVLTLAALVMIIASGSSCLRGPPGTTRQPRALRQQPALLVRAAVLHLHAGPLWGKFAMAAWRGPPGQDLDHRAVAFLASIAPG